MLVRRLVVLAAVLASTVVMPARPALACSCVPIDAASALGEVPAAFVGTVVEIRQADDPRDFREVVFTFSVDEWIKGDLGGTVEMLSSADGASCGFEMSPGQQSGVLIRSVGAVLTGGLCDRVDAAMLRAATAPQEAPTGSGPIAMLAAGSFGGSGLIAFDASGAILGYGERIGDGFSFPRLSVCPGAVRLVELVGDRSIFVRDLTTLALIDDFEAEGPGYFRDVSCRSADASDLVLFGNSGDRSFVMRGGPAGLELLVGTNDLGADMDLRAAGDRAVGVSRSRDPQLMVVDLDTGDVRVAHRYERPPGTDESAFVEFIAVSPSGRFVATTDAAFVDDGVDYYLSVFDLEADEALVARSQMPEFGEIFWVGDDLIGYALLFHLHDDEGGEVPGDASGTLQLYRATDLTLQSQWPGWEASRSVSVGGTLFGISHEGSRLVSADADAGPMVELRVLSGSVFDLVVVPDGPEIDPDAAVVMPEPPRTTTPPATLAPGAATLPDGGGSAGPETPSRPDDQLALWPILILVAIAAAGLVAVVVFRGRARRDPERLAAGTTCSRISSGGRPPPITRSWNAARSTSPPPVKSARRSRMVLRPIM